MNNNYEIIAKYFSEIAGTCRVQILNCLKEKDACLSDIAEKIDATPQEVHRNLKRLVVAGIIVKTNTGQYEITDIGRMVTSIFSIPIAIHQNMGFFKSHSFTDLPTKFLSRMGELEDCQLLTSVTRVLEKRKSIIDNSNQYIFESLSEPIHDTEKTIMEKIKQGVTYRLMLSKEYKSYNQEKLETRYNNSQNKSIQQKFLSNIHFGLIINESEAGIIFPDRYSELDLRYMVYGNTTCFHDWCIDLYDHYWNIQTNKQEAPKLIEQITP